MPITWYVCCDDSMFFHAEFLRKPAITQLLLSLLSLKAYIQEHLTASCLVSGKWTYMHTHTHTNTLMHMYAHRHAHIYIYFPLHIWLFVGSLHIKENARSTLNLTNNTGIQKKNKTHQGSHTITFNA